MHLLRLVNGVVTERSLTPEEETSALEAAIRHGLLRIILEDRFELENRVRALEGSPAITRAQFITALKNRLGL